MPLGDADLASGVFFADFGVPVVFGAQTTMGNFDAPQKDGIFGGQSNVSDAEYRVEIAASAFTPLPAAGSKISVAGVAYSVRSADPLDDGKVVEIKLRKL